MVWILTFWGDFEVCKLLKATAKNFKFFNIKKSSIFERIVSIFERIMSINNRIVLPERLQNIEILIGQRITKDQKLKFRRILINLFFGNKSKKNVLKTYISSKSSWHLLFKFLTWLIQKSEEICLQSRLEMTKRLSSFIFIWKMMKLFWQRGVEEEEAAAI